MRTTLVSFSSWYCRFIWRARPKSMIFSSHFVLMRMLEGFRSRCTMCALCMYKSPQRS